jgi:hypothetical protein
MANMADIPDEASYAGEFTDRWSYTNVRDWVLLYPDLSRTSLHLYLILRSMIVEKRDTGLRRMTIDQLCYLLPGIDGKDTSRTAGKDALRNLLEEGFLVCLDDEGSQPSGPRKYLVKDLPPRPNYDGWRNAWDKLDAYTPNWREEGRQRREQIKEIRAAEKRGKALFDSYADRGVVGNPTTVQNGTNEGGRISDQGGGGRFSDQGGRISGARKAVTCTNEASKKPLSSSSARGDGYATPEAPLEEDEKEIRGDKHNPSAEPREWSEERAAFEKATGGVQEALAGAMGFLGTLPGLTGLQEGAYGFLADIVVAAFDAGWTQDTLKTHLKPLVDPGKAKNPGAVPTWYARHLAGLPEAPRPVVPLCRNPAHTLNPTPDPVNGGCLPCNTQAATGRREKTRLEPEEATETTDAVTAMALCRQAVTTRNFAGRPDTPRDETPALRAWRQADQSRRQANDLIRTEAGAGTAS